MKTRPLSCAIIATGILLFAISAHAETAEDCIAEYELVKARFLAASLDAGFECIRMGTALNLFATGSPPLECTGEDEWHFEAKSVAGNPGLCKVRLMGSEGEGCSAGPVEHQLATPQAAQWQNFLFAECRELGTIRGKGTGE